jgi:hypothetical protein
MADYRKSYDPNSDVSRPADPDRIRGRADEEDEFDDTDDFADEDSDEEEDEGSDI